MQHRIAILALVILSLSFCVFTYSGSYAKEPMRVPMSGGRIPLDVTINPVWDNKSQVQFKIGFYQRGNYTLQPFIHYDLKLFNASSSKPVYDSADYLVQTCPTSGDSFCTFMTTYNGSDTVPGDHPLKLSQGNYRVEIDVFSIFSMMNQTDDTVNPARTVIPIQVTPELPSATGLFAMSVTSVIILTVFLKRLRHG